MNIFQKLTAKPWLASSTSVVDTEDIGFAVPSSKVSLRLFMTVVSVLFILFFVTLFERAQLADWRSLAAEPGQPLWEPWLLWINTGLLALGSVALQFSCRSAASQKREPALLGLLIGGLLTIGFIIGQIWFWQKLSSWGYFLADNPATSFFYMLTGVHALHLLGGLVAWSRTLIKFTNAETPLGELKLSLELCTVYWHFLLVVWLLVFLLLSSSPETFEAIAAMCGLR